MWKTCLNFETILNTFWSHFRSNFQLRMGGPGQNFRFWRCSFPGLALWSVRVGFRGHFREDFECPMTVFSRRSCGFKLVAWNFFCSLPPWSWYMIYRDHRTSVVWSFEDVFLLKIVGLVWVPVQLLSSFFVSPCLVLCENAGLHLSAAILAVQLVASCYWGILSCLSVTYAVAIGVLSWAVVRANGVLSCLSVTYASAMTIVHACSMMS